MTDYTFQPGDLVLVTQHGTEWLDPKARGQVGTVREIDADGLVIVEGLEGVANVFHGDGVQQVDAGGLEYVTPEDFEGEDDAEGDE